MLSLATLVAVVVCVFTTLVIRLLQPFVSKQLTEEEYEACQELVVQAVHTDLRTYLSAEDRSRPVEERWGDFCQTMENSMASHVKLIKEQVNHTEELTLEQAKAENTAFTAAVNPTGFVDNYKDSKKRKFEYTATRNQIERLWKKQREEETC